MRGCGCWRTQVPLPFRVRGEAVAADSEDEGDMTWLQSESGKVKRHIRPNPPCPFERSPSRPQFKRPLPFLLPSLSPTLPVVCSDSLFVHVQLLDEFLDVNSGEKAFMKLWNGFIAKSRFDGKAALLADHHVYPACRKFVQTNEEVLR